MVSLAGTGAQGMSFEERSERNDLSQDEEDSDVFHEDSHEILISSTNVVGNFSNTLTFKRVDTLFISFFMIILSIGMFVISGVVPFECDNHLSALTPVSVSNFTSNTSGLCFIKPVSFLVYLHCLMWAVFLICDQYIQYQHIKARRRGYMDFYNETRVTSQLSFWVVSAWSTLLLAVSTVLHDHCTSGAICGKSVHLTKTEYITVCVGLETVALIVVISSYIYQVWRFNTSKNPPDVFRDDMMSCVLDFNPDSLGRVHEEIFHRQADLIRYYKDRNVVLQRTVLHLNNQLIRRGLTPNMNA